MLALRDVATAAGDSEYRIIGGHMVRLLQHIYNVPTTPRLTMDADVGIVVDAAVEGSFHDRLTRLGYTPESGNRYVRGDQAVDLLVPTEAKPGRRIIGERAFDGAPGLRLALALNPIRIAVTARLTGGDTIGFEIPVPDVEAAFAPTGGQDRTAELKGCQLSTRSTNPGTQATPKCNPNSVCSWDDDTDRDPAP
jgi:hypothetical protein